MDFSSAPRLAPTSATPAVARSEVIAEKDSVSVDLAPERTVQSAPAGDAVKLDIKADDRREERRETRDARTEQRRDEQIEREQAVAEVIERRLVIEPRTRSIVLEKKNVETGETVQLVPDEATLKLRILSRQIADRARDDASARLIERTA